ncbi:MAG: hypothetical protein MUD06_14665 [Rhodospirillales bacterium]|nr:hypothetical protein [Rhodospirillales bacterium]
MAQTTLGPAASEAGQWTVDGVSAQAQAEAVRAADRDGLTLGAWVEAAIMRAVERGLDAAEPSTPPAEDPRPSRRYF